MANYRVADGMGAGGGGGVGACVVAVVVCLAGLVESGRDSFSFNSGAGLSYNKIGQYSSTYKQTANNHKYPAISRFDCLKTAFVLTIRIVPNANMRPFGVGSELPLDVRFAPPRCSERHLITYK